MLASLLAGLLAAVQPAAPAVAVIAEIRVHGNLATPEAEILEIAEVRPGEPFLADMLERVAGRLEASRRFERVEVLKRFASLTSAEQILLVIVVDEGPVTVDWSEDAAELQVARRAAPRLMFFPILEFQDGYGLTYGARLAVPDPAGARSRLAFPLTWGGEKRAAAVLEKYPASRLLTRVEAAGFVASRTHPFFDVDDRRAGVRVGAERAVANVLRASAHAGIEDVSFGGLDDRLASVGAALVFDTRIDPVSARDAVYTRVAWTRFDLGDQEGLHQIELDGRGYIGLFGQQVLALRAQRTDVNRPAPPYLQPMLGGTDSLRGLAAGAAVGDTLVAGSAELRVPLTSPLSFGTAGISGFVDVGTVYGKGESVRKQRFDRGVGAAWWFSAAIVTASVAVARGIGVGTRVHFSTSLAF